VQPAATWAASKLLNLDAGRVLERSRRSPRSLTRSNLSNRGCLVPGAARGNDVGSQQAAQSQRQTASVTSTTYCHPLRLLGGCLNARVAPPGPGTTMRGQHGSRYETWPQQEQATIKRRDGQRCSASIAWSINDEFVVTIVSVESELEDAGVEYRSWLGPSMPMK
jgi:hypothetical protein